MKQDEEIQRLQADLRTKDELAHERLTVAALRSSIQQIVNIDQVKQLFKDQQTLFLSNFNAILWSLSNNRINPSDLTAAGDRLKDNILARILPEFRCMRDQQDAVNGNLGREFEQRGVALEDLGVRFDESLKRSGDLQRANESLVTALQGQVDGVNQMTGLGGTSHSTPTPNQRGQRVVVSDPERDSMLAGTMILVAEERSRRCAANTESLRSAIRTPSGGVTKTSANSQRLSPSEPFTTYGEWERARSEGRRAQLSTHDYRERPGIETTATQWSRHGM